MSVQVYPFRANKQFERFIGQFMKVMSGFQVKDGVERNGSDNLKRVPVRFGKLDRIVASIMSKRDSLAADTIPVMVVTVNGIGVDDANLRSRYHKDAIVKNKAEPNDYIERVFGMPLVLSLDVAILASSNSELYELLEQILMVFNPKLVVDLDDTFNTADYITSVQLMSISDETEYPIGDMHSYSMTLTFEMPVRIAYPHNTEGTIKEVISQIITDENDDPVLQVVTEDDL